MVEQIIYVFMVQLLVGADWVHNMPDWSTIQERLKWVVGKGYRELIFISLIIGVVSGVGSIIFIELLKLFQYIFFNYFVGFNVPSAENFMYVDLNIDKPFLIPIIVAIGGLVSGFLVYTFAPEAEGHGTDAAIAAFHRFAGKVRRRVPFIKMISSIFTISSGGSAGREGPMAQIGAGIGSYFADLLKVNPYYRRLAVVVGIGAGIGTIFKAPLGGAIFGIEVLYKRDFEAEALLPAFIAAVIGYAIFGAYSSYTPVFDIPKVAFSHPNELIFYSVLGVLTAVFGMIYVKLFYLFRVIFKKISLSNVFKPLIGGALVGVIGIFVPEILGTGYGWIPYYTRGVFPIYDFLHGEWIILDNWYLVAVLFYILAFLKIIATSLTIGSGGSGGVFAPGLGIGAFIGAASSLLFIQAFPGHISNPESFLTSSIIIGMMSLFAGVSKAPVAVLIMVSEMTGSYELIAPSMLSIAISYLLSGDYTIYGEQVEDRPHSPAHIRDYHKMILEEIHVKDVINTRYPTLSPDVSISSALSVMMKRGVRLLPVIKDGKFVGIASFDKLRNISKDKRQTMKVAEIIDPHIPLCYPHETLFEILRKMTKYKLNAIPVVESDISRKYLGMITKQDVTEAHDQMIRFLIGEEEIGL